jgi:hypothetical protein
MTQTYQDLICPQLLGLADVAENALLALYGGPAECTRGPAEIWSRGSTQSLTAEKQDEHRNALSCAFEPEVGFQPTTFRLRVETHPSSTCQPGRF